MAKLLKEVPIVLDRERSLAYNFNAIAALEKETGENPFSAEFWQNIGPLKVRAILWAGLLHSREPLTIEQVGELMELSEIDKYIATIGKAWEANNPPKKDDGSTPPTPAA